jgi:hypothetical protein
MSTNSHPAPNLTQRPPRSPRAQLGDCVILPRILDQGRAGLAGTAGEDPFSMTMWLSMESRELT